MLSTKKLLYKILDRLNYVETSTYQFTNVGTLSVRKTNHVINISFGGVVKNWTKATWVTIATMGDGEKPTGQEARFCAYDNNTAQGDKTIIYGRVTMAGEVQVWIPSSYSSANQPEFTVTYVVGGVIHKVLSSICDTLSAKGVAVC